MTKEMKKKSRVSVSKSRRTMYLVVVTGVMLTGSALWGTDKQSHIQQQHHGEEPARLSYEGNWENVTARSESFSFTWDKDGQEARVLIKFAGGNHGL
ncbi:MAG: hypothetical protein ACRD37_09310 [Candidatus Acidiferrales bacterium]